MFTKKTYIIFTFCWFVVSNVLAQENENLIFEKLNFDHPSLKLVKENHKKGNYKKALKELLVHYQLKENLYLQIKKEDVNSIKLNYPEEVKSTLKTANQVLKKYFIYRYDWDMEKTNIPYQFKGEIDWKAIPNDDEEWCYMLNRHRFWVDLGKAYLLTGKEKYAKSFVTQVTHWIDNNPLEKSLINFSWRRIEAGIRCENWIKSFEYIKNSKHVTSEFLEKFLNSLYQHGKYLNSNFSNFSKTSNWGVLEFHGLFNLAHFLTEFKVAVAWQQDAIDKLTTCIKLQVLDDGSQWEQSPMYHNEVFHCFTNVNLIAQRKKIKLPQVIVKKTIDMAYANVKWQKPNFHQPLLGDSDDTDTRGLLTLASYIFADPVLKSRAFSSFNYETLFLLGTDKLKMYQEMKSVTPRFLSTYLKNSGDFYMRNSWKENATYTSLHLKKLGCGHGHDNLLHFTLFANQRDYLIDGGRYSYVNNEWRNYFKSNKSHNTLAVDNLPNSIYKDSWTNTYEARSQGIFTKQTTEFDYAEAENKAYKRLKDPVYMKRRMLFLKPNIWLIFDSFSANGKHKYSQYFNFPNKDIEINNKALQTTYQKNNLRIQPVNDVKIELKDAWWSPEYNLKKESKRAELYKNTTGFTSFISLLYFPEKTELKYEKTPVYSRNNKLLSDKEAEALTVYINSKAYTLLIVHNPSAPATHFFKVKDQLVQGEVVFIETQEGKNKIHIIKS